MKSFIVKYSTKALLGLGMGYAITAWKQYIYVLNKNGLYKIGTGYQSSIKGKIYGCLKKLYLNYGNIAWMCAWTNKNIDWILVRFKYDMNVNTEYKDDEQVMSDGEILVIDAGKLSVIGSILQNGRGSIATNDNLKLCFCTFIVFIFFCF